MIDSTGWGLKSTPLLSIETTRTEAKMFLQTSTEDADLAELGAPVDWVGGTPAVRKYTLTGEWAAGQRLPAFQRRVINLRRHFLTLYV